MESTTINLDDLLRVPTLPTYITETTSMINNNNNGTFTQENIIYIAFYKPDEMASVPQKPYRQGVHEKSFINPVLYYLIWINSMIFLYNMLWLGLKKLMIWSNLLTVRMTKNQIFPEACYSHVEIGTNHCLYYTKWGTYLQKTTERLVSASSYGVLGIPLIKRDYDAVVRYCESYCNHQPNASSIIYPFNYIGSVVNFICPPWIIKNICCFEHGVYVDSKRKFCSEFVAEALMRTETFQKYFNVDFIMEHSIPIGLKNNPYLIQTEYDSRRVPPSIISPNDLYVILMYYQRETNGLGIINTTKNLKPIQQESVVIQLRDDNFF